VRLNSHNKFSENKQPERKLHTFPCLTRATFTPQKIYVVLHFSNECFKRWRNRREMQAHHTHTLSRKLYSLGCKFASVEKKNNASIRQNLRPACPKRRAMKKTATR